jgi:hypothetical protein
MADHQKYHRRKEMRTRWLCALLAVLNGPLAYYFGRWHQAAPVSLVCARCLPPAFRSELNLLWPKSFHRSPRCAANTAGSCRCGTWHQRRNS